MQCTEQTYTCIASSFGSQLSPVTVFRLHPAAHNFLLSGSRKLLGNWINLTPAVFALFSHKPVLYMLSADRIFIHTNWFSHTLSAKQGLTIPKKCPDVDSSCGLLPAADSRMHARQGQHDRCALIGHFWVAANLLIYVSDWTELTVYQGALI